MNDENSASMLRRSKRLALTDISNVVQPFSDKVDRIVKKRKTLSDEPVAILSDSTSLPNDTDESSFSESVDLSAIADANSSLQVNTSSVSFLSSSEAERELELKGYIQPKLIVRKFPLRLKSADPAECLDMLDEIYGFYYAKEEASMANLQFGPSSEITPRMRTILVDWLVEVHYKYKLHAPTLWLCINILDRYMERTNFPRNQLQLAGIAALFIACKFEEFRAPRVIEFVNLTDSAYQQEEILAMEFKILETLNYDLLVPTTNHFLQRYLHCLRATDLVRLLASFYAERTIQEVDYFRFKPHVYAAASVYLALRSVQADAGGAKGDKLWSSAMAEETMLEEKDLLECARILVFNAAQTPLSSSKRKLEAVKKKYNTRQTLFVALRPLPTV